jgi:phosphoglycolate phosphatase
MAHDTCRSKTLHRKSEVGLTTAQMGEIVAYHAALFDLDGTLLDTLKDLTASLNFVLAAHGISPRSAQDVRAFTGDGLRMLARRAVADRASSANPDEIWHELASYYPHHAAELTCPYPGIESMIHELKQHHVACAVVSNKVDEAVQELVETFFPGLFDFVAGEREQDHIRKKPAPDILNTCMQALGVTPEDTVYVGDSEVDILSAHNAHTDCIAVTWGFRDEDYLIAQGATCLAHTTDELTRLILGGA